MLHKNSMFKIGMTLVTASMLLGGCKDKSKDVDQTITTPTVEAIPTITEIPSETPTPAPSATPEPTPTDAAPWLNGQINDIIHANPIYEKCTMDEYEFGDMFVLIFQPPESKKEFCEYYCDIWVVGDQFQTQVTENAYVDYEVFETGEIEGKNYFRYDLSYPSESHTNLLMMDENQELHQIGLGGGLIEINGNNLTVSHSTYDMCYMKSDGYAIGHTWKPYYCYLDGYELKEYNTHEVKEQDFKIYTGSSDIINQIVDDYSQKDSKLILKYLVWENNMVTISIGVETLNDITYYYETYQINTDQTLTKVNSGEGTYVGLMLNEDPYVRITHYDENNSTLSVEIVEWLCPWDENDKRRLQELIDQGKIEDTQDLWTSEFYLYEDPDHVADYHVSEDVKIELRAEDTSKKAEDKKILEKDLHDRIVMLTIVSNEVTEITEPYMP